MHLFFVFCLFAFLLCAKSVPQRCEKINVSYNEGDVIISVILYVNSSTEHGIFSNEVYVVDLKHDSNKDFNICINGPCFNDSVIPFATGLENGALNVNANVSNTNYPLFWGIIDEANFIFYDGRMFSEENKCLTYSDIDKQTLMNATNANITTCCTSFKPVISPRNNTPRCANFNLISTIYSTFDNTTLGTSSAEFVLSENNIIAKGEFNFLSVPSFSFFQINSMPCQTSLAGKQYCNYDLNSGLDGVIMVYIGQHPQINFRQPLALVGKIILRDGNTLMSEGIPFTTSNMCHINTRNFTLTKSKENDAFKVKIISEFCCTAFENSVPLTTPLPSPIIPSTNFSGQTCNQIHTFTKNSNLNITAKLNVTKINDTLNFISIDNILITPSINLSNIEICFAESVSLRAQSCKPFSNSLNFTGRNNLISINVFNYIDNSSYTSKILYYGIIDHGSFVSFDGSLFDMVNNICNVYDSNGTSTTSCCINFNDMIQINPTNENRCKSFQASSILYSTNDNSVYSKASANFVITDTDIIATGDFSNSFAPIYSINGKRLQIGPNNTQFGGYPIKTSNTDILIYMNYFQDVMNYNSAFVGRIIFIFNGQTFMDQNNSYTPLNNCYNFTAPYYDININYNITVVSQLCCTLFSDNSEASTTTLSSKSSSISKVSTSLSSSIMSTSTTKSFLTSTTAYTTTTSNSNIAYFFFHVFLVLSFLFGL